jgi:hypothetical protein
VNSSKEEMAWSAREIPHESAGRENGENAKVYIRATRSIGNWPLVVAFHELRTRDFLDLRMRGTRKAFHVANIRSGLGIKSGIENWLGDFP